MEYKPVKIRQIVFQNGDKIDFDFDFDGNAITFISEIANKIGHQMRKLELKGMPNYEYAEEIIIPNTNGLDIFYY